MPTIITHPVFALTLFAVLGRQRVSLRLLLLSCALTILPDADVIAFQFGIPYESPYGHRGFTHSFFFAACVALICVPFHRRLRSAPWVVGLMTFTAVASHAVLDGLTNGGLGSALWWPFTEQRFFLPWQPLEVSPIGVRRFLSQRGLTVLWSEIVWIWLPSVVVASIAIGLRRMQSRRSE